MGYTPPSLEIRKVAGGWNIYGDSLITGDDITMFSNLADSSPYISLKGNANVIIGIAAGWGFSIYDGLVELLSIDHDGTDCRFNSNIADHDLFLKPSGTGIVKFGTWTASGDVAVNGSIAVKDALGNARKLATIA